MSKTDESLLHPGDQVQRDETGSTDMSSYIDTYIRLCSTCSLDQRTICNMRNSIIPALQQEVEKYRAMLSELPCVLLLWQEIEQEKIQLEQAIASGLARCKQTPIQRELFAA